VRPNFLELLRLLAHQEIDFIVVGGVAAILEGVPITTLDLDILCDQEPENLERLLSALRAVHAHYRDPAGRDIEPTIERLATLRQSLLRTELGPLDVLSEIGAQATYQDLLPSTRVREVANLQIRVLELARVIETKEQAGRDKDLAMLPVLRRTLELKRESE
jgi:hypothetical protein